MEYCMIPMSNVKITQGRFESPSHQTRNAYDLAGLDTGIENVVTPFTSRVEYVSSSSLVVLTNTEQVKLPSGVVYNPYSLQASFFHDNNVADLSVGQIIPQGSVFYQEGTNGNATGNHIHIQMAITPYQGGYPLIEISSGVWDLKGTKANIEDFYFISNANNVIDNGGYTFKLVEDDSGDPIDPTDPLVDIKTKHYRFLIFKRKSQY